MRKAFENPVEISSNSVKTSSKNTNGCKKATIPVPQKQHAQHETSSKFQPQTNIQFEPDTNLEENVLSPLQTALQNRNLISSTWPPANFLMSASPPRKTTTSDASVDQKTIEYLIGTLNLSYPDYDFRNLKPRDFIGNVNQHDCFQTIQSSLRDVFSAEQLIRLWSVLEKIITIKECEIIMYEPPDADEFDPLIGNKTKLWGWTYFFLHRKLKKIVYFSCCGTNAMQDESDDELDEDQDQEMFAIDEDDQDM